MYLTILSDAGDRNNIASKELIDMADYTSVDINEIDLDGDSKKEYIVCYTYNASNDDYDGGEMKASSGIMLFDSNYKKISDLVSLIKLYNQVDL